MPQFNLFKSSEQPVAKTPACPNIIARVAVVWCALREAFEEKTEEIMTEPIELLTHIAPQLAALV
jgi:hypothetical protein